MSVELLKLATIKRGDTFSLYAELEDLVGDPLILAVENIRSQVRTSNNKLIAELIIEVTETPGRYLLKYTDTVNWPVGDLFMDIQVNNNGIISSSETFIVPIARDVTRDE